MSTTWASMFPSNPGPPRKPEMSWDEKVMFWTVTGTMVLFAGILGAYEPGVLLHIVVICLMVAAVWRWRWVQKNCTGTFVGSRQMTEDDSIWYDELRWRDE